MSEHISHAFFKEPFINTHEFSNKCLQMVNGFRAKLQAVLVVGCYLCHFSLQCPVAAFHNFLQQALSANTKFSYFLIRYS